MRYGLRSQLAPLDCTSSRRSTVMCALPWATGVTTEYQRDSSSKRPRSSVVFAARALEHRRDADTASRASRPAGRRLRRPWTPRPPRAQGSYASKLTLARDLPSRVRTNRGLTKGHSISVSRWDRGGSRAEIAENAKERSASRVRHLLLCAGGPDWRCVVSLRTLRSPRENPWRSQRDRCETSSSHFQCRLAAGRLVAQSRRPEDADRDASAHAS